MEFVVIVVDENIQRESIIRPISSWYPGQVISVTDLRRQTNVQDDGIETLLHRANDPTFVTINVSDFWLKLRPHKGYCIIGIVLLGEKARLLPEILRNVLGLSQFRTKAARMGTIVRVRSTVLEYYGTDRQIHRLPWPPD